MVVLDGVCYQISFDGKASDVKDDHLIPYAVVTRFNAEFAERHPRLLSFSELVAACDQLRKSENLFYAFRIDGVFPLVKTRVMKPVPEGTGLKAAASAQQEFLFQEQEETLVGLWLPGFASSFSVSGYHFHFLFSDRKRGGHVLELRAEDVTIEGCAMHEMHVSLLRPRNFSKPTSAGIRITTSRIRNDIASDNRILTSKGIMSPNTSKSGAQIVVESLERHGVTHVFGIPGAKIDKVFDTLKSSSIETVGESHRVW